MKTALDSSVILDVVVNDPEWADASERALIKAGQEGCLLIGECVLAEITPALELSLLHDFLMEWGVQFIPSSRESASLAGEMYRRYLERKGGAKRILPDFLIGAHAKIHAERLLARDRGYYRDYFDGLVLMEPV